MESPTTLLAPDATLLHACPVCDAASEAAFFEAEALPAHVGIQWDTRARALACPRGDLRLHFCPSCGHIYNSAFDPAVMAYSEAYDNSLHYSPRFQQYTDAVVQRLVDRYDLRGKQIVEIGCGKGDFLMALCAAGKNHGIGFDPSYEPRELPHGLAERVSFVQDFYSEAYAHHEADLICSRYVFEHIDEPAAFLQMVRRAIGERAGVVVYFEVPNVDFILKDLSIWDIIYEHCGYFGARSLAEVFARTGFEVRDVVAGYDGQFVGIEAVSVPDHRNGVHRWGDVAEMTAHVAAYADNVATGLAHWRTTMADLAAQGKQCVLWGAGAKAVSFLNMLDLGEQVDYVVDINPNKHGLFMPGTGQMIVPPVSLANCHADVVIVMNPIYAEEIREMTESLGLDVDFVYAS